MSLSRSPSSQLRGDQQPALAGAPEPQAGGRLLRLVFACGSEPCVVTPPEGWDGRPPTLARRSVEWGKTGGTHSQQLANAIFVLENGEEVRVSLEEPLSQLRGDQQPALAGAPEPQAGGRLLRLVFACGSEPCVVTPPEGWDGRPPTLARRSVEWGKTGGERLQQLANAIFVLENGEEVRVSLEEPLSQLRGDQQPALAGAPEPQAGGRLLRLVFACGSEPCVVTPPEGWDGRPPTLARRSVEWIERRALFASAIFRLTSGSEVRVSLEEPLVQLRGDQQPALAGAPEPQAGGRLLRLVFACGSEPCVVTPPEGWDGRPPTLARRSVEAARAGGRARHGLGLAPGLAVQVRPGGEWGACRADGAAFDVGAWQEAQTTNHAALILAAINEKWRLECNLFGDPLGRRLVGQRDSTNRLRERLGRCTSSHWQVGPRPNCARARATCACRAPTQPPSASHGARRGRTACIGDAEAARSAAVRPATTASPASSRHWPAASPASAPASSAARATTASPAATSGCGSRCARACHVGAISVTG